MNIGKAGITDTNFVLEMLGKESFIEYMNTKNEDQALETELEKHRLTDGDLSDLVFKDFGIRPNAIQNCEKDERDRLLEQILKYEGISSRQLARISGISANIIWKIASK